MYNNDHKKSQEEIIQELEITKLQNVIASKMRCICVVYSNKIKLVENGN